MLTHMVNTAILILTIYMSGKFSQPLTNFGESFLLVYQGDLAHLSDTVNVHRVEYARAARGAARADKYHKEASKDAER